MPISPEKWVDVEKQVNDAEIADRQAKQASKEIFLSTAQDKESRLENTDDNQQFDRVTKKALAREGLSEQERENLLGGTESLERDLVEFRSQNLHAALLEYKKLEKDRQSLLLEESAILKKIDGQPTGNQAEALAEIRQELDGIDKNKQDLMESSPEAFFGLHLKDLKDYKKQMEAGRIVETPYVAEQAEDIVAHMRAGKPILIYGHLGSGKTELAMHIAREKLGKEALVISGSRYTSLAELYGHQILDISKVKEDQLDSFMQEVSKKFSDWVTANPEATEEDKNRSHDTILQTYLTKFQGGTISDFFLGPIYRAMEEGRPVIIDEVNAIPHDVLISLNHILTRKTGETINVQQDSGRTVTVQDGFGVMMTGNLNQGEEKYIDRQDMDPAFLSRLHKIEYDYLPQSTEGTPNEAGEEDELFHLLLAKVMDRNGNIEAPQDTTRKLWKLSQAARLLQNVFAGREVDSAFYFKEGGGRAAKYLLKEAVLSIRALDNVLRQWQADGYRYDLDHYIYQEFVSQSTVASDRAYIYQILKDQFGFFQGDGWEQNPSYGQSGLVSDFKIKVPKNQPNKIEFLGARQTVEVAFGQAPERTNWPEVDKNEAKKTSVEEVDVNIEKIVEFQKFQDKISDNIAKLEQNIGQLCEVPRQNQATISRKRKK